MIILSGRLSDYVEFAKAKSKGCFVSIKLYRFIWALLLLVSPMNVSAQQEEYDAQRLADILKISDMVEAYYRINKHYPFVHEPQIEVINILIGDSNLSHFPATVPYQMLESELQQTLGINAVLPKNPDTDGLPYIYATNGQFYYVSAFLFHKKPYAWEQGRNVNKVEVTNSPRRETQSHKPSYLRHVVKYGADDASKQANLFKALEKRNFNAAAALIDSGANLSPTCEFNHRCQPLATASMEGDLELMEFLIDQGADLDGSNAHYDVPLIYALSYGHIEAAELLIEAGANVNLPNAFGISPFIGATAGGNNELIMLMIEKGADLNKNYFLRVSSAQLGDKNSRPLEFAIKHNQSDIVSLLLNAGADPGLQATTGETISELGRKSQNELIRIQF